MTEKLIEVVKNPDTPVGKDFEQPTKVTFNAIATEDANGGAPIVVSIFALSSDHRFYGYDLYSIVNDSKGALGPTLTDQLDEISLVPGKYEIFGPYEMPEKTRFIAVVAHFKDHDVAVWRDTIKVNAMGDIKNALLSVQKNKISSRIED